QLDALKLRLAVRFSHSKQSAIASGPYCTRTVFEQNVDAIRNRVITDTVTLEMKARSVLSRPVRVWSRIQKSYPVAISSHPADAGSWLEKIIDRRRRQTVFNVVRGKASAVKTAQPVGRAKPQQAKRVANYLSDLVVRQAVRCCIGFDRQPLSRSHAGQDQQD